MLIDHRTYRVRPGTVQGYLDNYEQYGLAAQTRHIGKPIAYMFTESGEMNTIVHIWAYENAGDREAKRARMQADPEWQKVAEESQRDGKIVEKIESVFVDATDYSPLK